MEKQPKKIAFLVKYNNRRIQLYDKPNYKPMS